MDAIEPDSRATESQEAHRRAMRTHLSAAHLHRDAAEVHRRAAVHHEVAAKSGAGDAAWQKEAAALERAAILRDLEAADREAKLARIESQRLARELEGSSSATDRAETEAHS